MKTEKRKRLEKAGYAVFDDARDWLGFTEEEKILSDMQIAAARELERLRAEQGGAGWGRSSPRFRARSVRRRPPPSTGSSAR